MNAIRQLFQAGQSVWFDNIQRAILQNGELAGMIERGEISGITSNPTIFMHAITGSDAYDESLRRLAKEGKQAEEIFWALAIEDIRAAADLLCPVYDATQGGDGYVSIEVNPLLANDSAGSVAEALHLWKTIQRPNLMVKIPATAEGIPAIAECIAAGVNVNITLIFSRDRYEQVMEAYLSGLEQRVARNEPVGQIASVASFFVSRVDSLLDPKLEQMAQSAGTHARAAKALLGRVAIANARLAYADFLQVFGSPRFKALSAHGARLQRPLWASTSTKNPNYRDVMYVEELIGPNTVNTIPPKTIEAFLDHGRVRTSIGENLPAAREALASLEACGLSLDAATTQLEIDGVKAFSDSYHTLIAAVEEKRRAVS